VASSNVVQGLAAVAGLGAVVVRVQPLFQALRWAGIAYLTYLAIQAFRSAWAGRAAALPDEPRPTDGPGSRTDARAGWRQGFLSNITNPKVLVFYLAVLPQFIGPTTQPVVLLVVASSHAVLSLAYLLLVVTGLHRVRRVLARRRVRRVLDAATGTLLVGFGVRLATEQA
jgi:threonine/homoserine/homoserine lactone efflux protein